MRNFKSTILSLIFSISFWAEAQVEPTIQWKTLRSSHFDLIYDARQQELASAYLLRAERARLGLQQHWNNFPDRLTLILNDRTDLTNGYATALPYAHIMLFPVLPGPNESISEFEDWGQDVLTHEFAHVLTFEQRRGGVEKLSWVFGRIVTPNMLLPRWWHEGLAVTEESLLSRQGRLRSEYQDASLRALASDSNWQKITLAEINESNIPTFPYGARPYLYGSLLWSELLALKGHQILQDLNFSMGGRVPYFLSGPVQDRFEQQTLADLWEVTKAGLAARVERQKNALNELPTTTPQVFHDESLVESFGPSISPDGLKMGFLAKDDSLKRSIQILIRKDTSQPFSADQRVKSFGQKTEVLAPGSVDLKIPRQTPDEDAPPGGTINRLSWRKDSKAFVFDLMKEVDSFHDASDLWTYSLETGRATPLTHDLRAREPAYSPSSSQIAFVKIEAGRTSLALLDVKTGKAKIIYKPDLMARVSWPVWLSEDKILFTIKSHGAEKLGIANLSQKSIQLPSLALKNPTLPLVRNDSIYFISGQNGVRNVYRADHQLNRVEAITHLEIGAWAFDLDDAREELWFSHLTAKGFALASLKPQKMGPLPVIAPLFADRFPVGESKNPSLLSEDAIQKEVVDYEALPYLWPRYWLPFIYWDDKGTQASVSTSGFDPLKKHAYTFFGSYDSALNHGNYQAVYQNQSWRPLITALTSDISSYLADPQQETRTKTNSVSALWQLPSLSTDLFAGLGVLDSSRDQFHVGSKQTGATAVLTYSSLSQSGQQISPESGGSAQLSLTQSIQNSEQEAYVQTNLNGSLYGKMPWGQHHAWMLRGAGQWVDQSVSISRYDSTFSSLAGLPPGSQAYLMRGYVTGAFLMKSAVNSSLEYRFPLGRIDRGPDSAPVYFHRMSGALISDQIWLDGFGYDTELAAYRRASRWKGYASLGLEAKLELTLGYHFPMQMILGLYAPFENEFSKSSPRFGLGIGL